MSTDTGRLGPILSGALGGATVALLLWGGLSWAIDRQVTATIDREVPPRLRSELDNKLRSMGITPEVAAALQRVMGTLDSGGFFRSLAPAGTQGLRGLRSVHQYPAYDGRSPQQYVLRGFR
jgi:hypothetical protein